MDSPDQERKDHPVSRAQAPDDTDVLVTAAVMYYEQNASQQEIADQLGVSRPTVSRLLDRAREQGIVRIEVVPPRVDPDLAPRLCALLGLRSVHIASGRANEAEPGPVLAEPLGAALDEAALSAGDTLIVSWGRGVYSASKHVLRTLPGVVVAPAMGGNSSDQPWFQPNEIVRSFTQTLGAQARYFHAPALITDALYTSLLHAGELDEALATWEGARASVVGVGAWPKPDPTYAAAGFPVDDPAQDGAVGDVAGRSFRIDGTLVPFHDQRRLLGVTPEQLARVPYAICLAGGVSKTQAAIGAARAHLYNVLVTDASTARAMDAFLASEAGTARA